MLAQICEPNLHFQFLKKCQFIKCFPCGYTSLRRGIYRLIQICPSLDLSQSSLWGQFGQSTDKQITSPKNKVTRVPQAKNNFIVDLAHHRRLHSTTVVRTNAVHIKWKII